MLTRLSHTCHVSVYLLYIVELVLILNVYQQLSIETNQPTINQSINQSSHEKIINVVIMKYDISET